MRSEEAAVVILSILVVLFLLPLVRAAGIVRTPRLRDAARRGLAAAVGLLAFTQARSEMVLLLVVALLLWFAPQIRLPARVRRRPPRVRVDPSAVTGVWSRLLREALAARAQFTAALRRTPRGAIREQLAELSRKVDAALAHAGECARRGNGLERAAGDLEAARRASARGGARWARGWRPLPTDPRVLAAQRDRDAAAGRLAASIAEERAQLQVLVARLTESACSAAELSVAAAQPALGPGSPDALARELVDRLAALRAGLEDASRSAAAA